MQLPCGKLVFEKGKCRTSGLNPVLALILQKKSELGNKKTERLDISDKTFGDVRKGGLEPPQIALLPPQGSASTSSATSAKRKGHHSTNLNLFLSRDFSFFFLHFGYNGSHR